MSGPATTLSPPRPARAWLLAAMATLMSTGACGTDLTPAADWQPWDSIDGLLRPELGPPPSQLPSAGRQVASDPLRVVTYNVNTAADIDGLRRALATDPDLAGAGLFLLQETESYPAEDSSRAATLAARLGLAYAYVPAREKADGTHGLAILSAFPIDNLEVMVLPRADVPRTGHVRIAVEADIDLGDRLLHVVDLHLDTSLNVNERVIQLRPAVIDQPDQVLVAGDFNTNDFVWADDVVPVLPVGSALDPQQAPVVDDFMGRLGYAAPTADFGPTETMYGVEERMDSIYLRGLGHRGGAVLRRVAVSDHWPVWLDVTVPP